jgi:hypothetical protein
MMLTRPIGEQEAKEGPTHVDDWLDTPTLNGDEGEKYAKFVLEHKRMPAWKKLAYEKWMRQFRLFCTYNGKRYRCTGASSLGDVWLAKDHNREKGYDMRVSLDDCSAWGSEP